MPKISPKQVIQKQRINCKVQKKNLVPERKENHNNANHLAVEINQEKITKLTG